MVLTAVIVMLHLLGCLIDSLSCCGVDTLRGFLTTSLLTVLLASQIQVGEWPACPIACAQWELLVKESTNLPNRTIFGAILWMPVIL